MNRFTTSYGMLILGMVLLVSSCSQRQPLPLDKWTYIQVDDSRTRYPGKTSGGGGWFGLAMGDLTGDGYKDIASGRWFYRDPGGDMTGHWARVTISDSIDNLLITDVDGDGRGDIIGAKCNRQFWFYPDDQKGSTYRCIQIGSLPVCNHHTSSQGYNLGQIVPGGKPEVILAGDGIYYMEIPDDPTQIPWPATTIMDGGNNGEWVSTTDMDGDGDIDVCSAVTIDGEGIGVAWWANPGDGSAHWEQHQIGRAEHWVDKVIGADVNGDGRKDLVVTEERYPGREPDANMFWFEGPQDPTQGNWARTTIVTQWSMNNLDVADMDQDGDPDIVTGEHKGPAEEVQIWENDGRAHFTMHLVDKGKESHLGTRLADLDEDGDLDIVSIAWEDFQYLHLWRNDAIKR